MASAAQSIIILQKPSFAWKTHSHHSPQFLPPHNYFSRDHIKIRKTSVKQLSVSCLFTTTNNPKLAANQHVSRIRLGEWETKQNPVEIVAETVMNMLRALRKPAVAALVVGLLLMYGRNSALAASGGRMGGSSFSSSGSRSRSSSGSGSYSTSSGSGSDSMSDSEAGISGSLIIVIVLVVVVVAIMAKAASVETSVLKLQVGLLGSAKSLQKELDLIAETADTSTSKGLHYVLTETVVALLRHPDYCISGYSSVVEETSMEAGETTFNQLSVEERGKLDEETLVNVNNIKKKSSKVLKADGFSNEYIVVTILVAAGGEHKLPSINSSKDLKEALQKLASITSTNTLAVEVLWTPQKENDSLSELELREDYPLLRPLQ